MINDEPLQRVLSQLADVRESNGGYQARCPAHDDRKASLSIGQGDDGRALLHCHAGCDTKAICRALGLRTTELFANDQETNGLGRIIAAYDYRDADGTLLFQVVRYEPKDFRQRRPNGNGGWNWKLGCTKRVLFRLPELLAASPDAWVVIPEGEKDVLRLVSVGLVATCNPGGAGKWGKLSDCSALKDRRVAIIADKDQPGRRHAADVAARLRGFARDVRVLEMPGDGKDVSDWLDASGTAEELIRLIESASDAPPPSATPRLRERPNIFIDTEEHRVVAETIAALTADPDLYQRGGILVRVIRDRQPDDGIVRCEGSATIQAMPAPNLRERMTRFAAFTQRNRRDIEVPAHPTPWLVSAVEARAEWDGIRQLMGISDVPVLRPDGTIWQQPGYDARTGVLYEPAAGASFPTIDPDVNLDDADAALTSLLDVVVDFPFESEEHKAAWVAGLLTPLARFAFAGPSPLFLVDANVRGAGKGLLVQAIGHIVEGRELPVSSYSHDAEEMRKKVTAIAIAGDRLILLDNLEGAFGNDALDRALTSTRWKDRILGKSEQVELPLIPAWYATGNNVQVAADTTRRIIHVRLDCLSERPEDRSGFAHENLLAWVDSQRGRLLAAALTILSAFLQRGTRPKGLMPFGSFEGWSRVVREAVVWVRLPDPCLTRTRLAESADTTGNALTALLAAWEVYDPTGGGIVVSEMLQRLYPLQRDQTPYDEASNVMRSALENLAGGSSAKPPTARQVGNKLRGVRRRVVGDTYLDSDPNEYHRAGAVWRLRRAERSTLSDATRVCESETEGDE